MGNLDIKNYKLIQEVSAGGVVLLKDSNETMVVTIEREKMRDFCLPKGHQDISESLQETAIREVREETGYDAEPTSYLGQFTYNVKSDTNKTITMRTVHWFLMEVIGGVERDSNDEVKRVILTPMDGDFSYLTYDNDRMFIDKAKEALKKMSADSNDI